ncbi:MAG: hypothetical protein ACTSYA_06425 [Candidatus Kariarchaeaceae archaeon]
MIQNIIITTSSGIPLFGRSLMCSIGVHCADLSVDTTMTDDTMLNSGLLNAMLIFNEAEPEKFHPLNLEKTNVLTYPTEEVTGVLTIEPQDNPTEYENRLKIIMDLFLEHYLEDVINFTGKINVFNDFQKILEDKEILDANENFRKNCIECEYDLACPFRITTGPLNRTFAERLADIKSLSFFKKWKLIIKGMFTPKILKA